ncbi:predicted protein [Nematostella vectensis]|uniref:Calcineurin-like phosphoesterase domain-containing protein n=1 Tax=Nematostella vectensis TaxID=45351 RepID=A7S2M8_NEMVE|nr:predicted protein [Nematostella vectensis]|eukprot:XP_001634094.1 predicted protein [Nematostella vectensis]
MDKFKGVFSKRKTPTDISFEKLVEEFHRDPTRAWDILEQQQKVQDIQPIDPETPKPEGHTRFVCISDTHCLHSRTGAASFPCIPDGDVLIHAGDFTMVGKAREVTQFNEFITSLPHPHKVVIAGNHDLPFDVGGYDCHYRYWRMSLNEPKTTPEGVRQLLDLSKIHYLEDSEITINGIMIYGTPWVPTFGSWAFMLDRGPDLQAKWDQIPDGTDVLVTHTPPLGYGDLCTSKLRAGCINLLHTVQTRVKPKYHIYGHIHEAYGVRTDGVTTYINASTANVRYKAVNRPVVFDLPTSVAA